MPHAWNCFHGQRPPDPAARLECDRLVHCCRETAKRRTITWATTFVTSEIANHLYAVVNVNVLANVDEAWLRRAPSSFEGEDIESRLARRKRNWIAKVRITEGGAK